MVLFTKFTAKVAVSIIENLKNNMQQPIMLEECEDGCHFQEANVKGDGDYNTSWVFASCDENGVCSFMELEDVAQEHGYTIRLSKNNRPLIVPKMQKTLCA